MNKVIVFVLKLKVSAIIVALPRTGIVGVQLTALFFAKAKVLTKLERGAKILEVAHYQKKKLGMSKSEQRTRQKRRAQRTI